MKTQPSYYDILKVSPNSSDEDIKRAYRMLVKKFHPDFHPHNKKLAEMRLRIINEAYNGIKTPEKRSAYNRGMAGEAENDNQNAGFFSQIGEIFWPKRKETPKQ